MPVLYCLTVSLCPNKLESKIIIIRQITTADTSNHCCRTQTLCAFSEPLTGIQTSNLYTTKLGTLSLCTVSSN